MATNGFLKEYNESLLDLTWSLWSELGVSGWQRNHSHWLIDPEELLVFTAWLGNSDARLREECIDWCIRSGEVLSVDRLKNILKMCKPETKSSFGEIATLVKRNKGPKLPFPEPTKRKYKPSRKSERPDLSKPSTLVLKLRKIFGVGAKAELISRFLLERKRIFTINELVREGIGFARITVSQSLDDLVEAGVIYQDRSQRDGHFSLNFRHSLFEALDLGLSWRPQWSKLFSLLQAGKRFLSPPTSKSPHVQKLDIAENQDRLFSLVSELGIQSAAPDPSALVVPVIAGAIGPSTGGVKGLFGGLAAAGVSLRGEEHIAKSRWLVEVASKLANGEYPGKRNSSMLNKTEFQNYMALRAIRAQKAHTKGYRPEFGTDQLLRELAFKRPATIEEIKIIAGHDIDLDEQLLTAYLSRITITEE